MFQDSPLVDPFIGCCSVGTFFLISSSQRAHTLHILDTADQEPKKGKAKTRKKYVKEIGRHRGQMQVGVASWELIHQPGQTEYLNRGSGETRGSLIKV